MKISDAKNLLKLFWPEFVSESSGIYLSGSQPVDSSLRGENPNVEDAYRNHVHILDYFEHEASTDQEPFWLRDHADFSLAIDLGKKVAEMWFEKLKRDFPGLEFRVYYCEHDNPIVRFHKIWPDFSNWLSAEDHPSWIEDGSLIILDSRA